MRRLSVGIAVAGTTVPRWVERLVAELEAAPHVSLDSVHVVDSLPAKSRGRLRGLYERLDRRVFRLPDDALDEVPLGRPTTDAARDLDVVLELTGAAPETTRSKRTWSVRHGRPGAAPDDGLFLDVLEGGPASTVAIQETKGRIATRGTFATYPISVHRNRHVAGWKTCDLMLRALADLARTGAVVRRSDDPELLGAAPKPRLSRLLAGIVVAAIRRQVQWKLCRETWFLAYRSGGGAWTPIDPPKGHFYADPFVVERDGRHHVFFEDYTRSHRRAAISHLEIDEHGPAGPSVVLDRGYHLSYPDLFPWDGETYMLPATERARTIELYRADPFPDYWTLERKVFEDVYAFDSTLVEYGGRVWLFTNLVQGHAAPSEELFLFWAESPAGPWTSHPLNPVVADVRRARPAGPLFRRGAALIRPSQDCGPRYGHAIVFNRVDVLTEDDYRETPIDRIEPGWRPGNVGTHTYCADGDLELIDGYRLRPRMPF